MLIIPIATRNHTIISVFIFKRKSAFIWDDISRMLLCAWVYVLCCDSTTHSTNSRINNNTIAFLMRRKCITRVQLLTSKSAFTMRFYNSAECRSCCCCCCRLNSLDLNLAVGFLRRTKCAPECTSLLRWQNSSLSQQQKPSKTFSIIVQAVSFSPYLSICVSFSPLKNQTCESYSLFSSSSFVFDRDFVSHGADRHKPWLTSNRTETGNDIADSGTWITPLHCLSVKVAHFMKSKPACANRSHIIYENHKNFIKIENYVECKITTHSNVAIFPCWSWFNWFLPSNFQSKL